MWLIICGYRKRLPALPSRSYSLRATGQAKHVRSRAPPSPVRRPTTSDGRYRRSPGNQRLAELAGSGPPPEQRWSPRGHGRCGFTSQQQRWCRCRLRRRRCRRQHHRWTSPAEHREHRDHVTANVVDQPRRRQRRRLLPKRRGRRCRRGHDVAQYLGFRVPSPSLW